jgi:RNA recognition motif-containing protein
MNLFVGNLSPETTANSLRTLFSEFGEVVSSKVIFDNATGMSRGFGFVEMADKFQAQNAVDNLDVSFHEGNIISVKEARQNTTGGGGGGGRSGGNSGGGNRQFKPRTPRPGGYNNSNSGGYNNSSSSGGYNNNNFNSGGGYNNNRY